MRVLMISSLWPPYVVGGAELYAARLADRLRADGHEVAVVTRGVDAPGVIASVPPTLYRTDQAAGQPPLRRAAFHLSDLYNVAARRVLDRAISEFRPDVVHTHAVHGMSSVAMTRPRYRGTAHVHTIHDYWLVCQRNTLMRADGTLCETRCRGCVAVSTVRSQTIRRSPPDIALAVSEAVAREHRILPWLSGRLRVLYNPVDDAPPVVHRDPAEIRRAPVFGYLGRVSAHKGVATLLEAFRRAAIPGATLRVAGRGELEDSLAGPGVEPLGWLDDRAKDELLASVDCLVVPSEWKDPAPLVVNEARARGVTVIGSDLGGIPELIAPEWRDLLARPSDPDALAQRLRQFAHDPARFAAEPELAPMGWEDHVRSVVASYTDARRAVDARAGRR
jgi:glycosyltransferase involved in cell wall biosynthesis